MEAPEVKERLFVLCTDGSEKSKVAFNELINEFYIKTDSVKVVMLTDSQKTYLSEDYSDRHVLEYFRNLLIPRVHQSKYEILFEERDSKKFSDPKSQLSNLVSRLKADYCFIGSFGRKGDKNEKYRVGQTAIMMVSQSKVPIVIVKDYFQRENNKTKGFNFACCIDGSAKSLQTLKHAQDLGRNPNDKIYAVTVDEVGEYTFLRDKIKDLTQAAADKFAVKMEDHLFGPKTDDLCGGLKLFIEEHPTIEFDFVLIGGMGVHGETDKTYTKGRIATSMMHRCSLNPIIIP